MRVLIESPYAGKSPDDTAYNVDYARDAVKDCLRRGESPYASHLFFTQPGILDDMIPAERELGINAGLEWGEAAEKTVVYIDRGISKGMAYGMEAANRLNRPIEYRSLPEWRSEATDKALIVLGRALFLGESQ